MSESSRLAFVTARDGIDGARDFARRTLVVYRRALTPGNRLSGYGKAYRRALVRSCLEFRRFLRETHDARPE